MKKKKKNSMPLMKKEKKNIFSAQKILNFYIKILKIKKKKKKNER